MIYPYAQINEAGVSVAESSLAAQVSSPGLVPLFTLLEGQPVPSLVPGESSIGRLWTGSAWADAPELPRIVITKIDAGEHAEQTRVAKDFSEVDVPVGATLAITAELRHGVQLLRLSESFRMPVTSTDGREKVVIASMDGGTITLRIPMTESRVWRVTQDAINRNLPADKHMAFAGLTVYAIEV